jgi:hypothetical protein
MSSLHLKAPDQARRDEVSGARKSPDAAGTLTWHQIIEWSDEDLARWRDAHKQPKTEPIS